MINIFAHHKANAKKAGVLLALCIALLMCSSCMQKKEAKLPVLEDYLQTTQNERSRLKVGIVAGPYEDMIIEIIQPLFSPKGYQIEFVLYNNYAEPNFALANGEIDLNMFQHYRYLNGFKFENDMNLSAIAEIPTAPMGIYSQKYSALTDVENDIVVAIPNDGTNLSRALIVLSDAGIISINSGVDITKVTVSDITKNPKNIQIIPVEAHLLPEMIEHYDLAVINGNFALSSGLNISDALFIAELSDHAYLNVIAVRTEDLSESFVLDLIDVLRSSEFKSEIMANGKYSSFHYPCNFAQ